MNMRIARLGLLLVAAPLLVSLGGCGLVMGMQHSPIDGQSWNGINLNLGGAYPGEGYEHKHYAHWKQQVLPKAAAKDYMKGRAFHLVKVTTHFDPVEAKVPLKRHILPKSAYSRMLAWELRRGLKNAKLTSGKHPAVQLRVVIRSMAYGWGNGYLYATVAMRKRSGQVLARLPMWVRSTPDLEYTNSAPWYQDHHRLIPSMAIVLVRTAKILNEGRSIKDVPYWSIGYPGPYHIGSRYGIKNPMTLKQTEQASGFTLAQLKAIQKKNLHKTG